MEVTCCDRLHLSFSNCPSLNQHSSSVIRAYAFRVWGVSSTLSLVIHVRPQDVSQMLTLMAPSTSNKHGAIDIMNYGAVPHITDFCHEITFIFITDNGLFCDDYAPPAVRIKGRVSSSWFPTHTDKLHKLSRKLNRIVNICSWQRNLSFSAVNVHL